MRIDKIMFKNENGQLNFIDLFAGAGGLSEGFFQAGFNPIAHVEMNKSASKTLETRSAYYYLRPADTYRRLRMAITYPDMDV